MATITIGPSNGVTQKFDIAWLGATTAINSTNFPWFTADTCTAIYAKSANRQGYAFNKPGAGVPSATQFVQAATGSLPFVYELNLKAQITLDSSLFAVIGGTTAPAPTLSTFSASTVSPGDTLTLTGANLSATAYVLIGGISSLITGTTTATSVSATVPLSATSGSVVVVTTGGYAVKGGLTVVAQGSSKLATPANLRQTTATANSNTMSWDAVPNASKYELQNGATTIYNGPDLTFTETSLTAGTPYPYKVRAIGVGVYANSDFSQVVSATPTAISSEINFINTGDSITAGPSQGTGSDPTNSPGVFAVQRILSPAVTLNKQGYPGQNIRYLLDNKKQAILDAIVPSKRNIISFAFGANDMNSRTRAQRRADFTEAATWAAGITGVEGVFFVPTLDRGDTGTSGYGYNLADDGVSKTDFWPAAMEHNAWIAANLPSVSSKVRVASLKNVRSLLGQQGWFNDPAFCTSDLIHPTIRGSKILGQLVLAEGIALFGGVTTSFITSPRSAAYESMNSNAAYVSGYMTKLTSDTYWDTNIRDVIEISQLGAGEKAIIEFDEPRAGHEAVLFGVTGAPITQTGFAFLDVSFYYEPGGYNLYQSGSPVFSGGALPRIAGKPRIEVTATSTVYYIGTNPTPIFTNNGTVAFPLYVAGSLGKTGSGGDLASEIPPCVITSPKMVAII